MLYENLAELDAPARYSLFTLANLLLFVWARYVVAPERVGWRRFLLVQPMAILCFFIVCLFSYSQQKEKALVMHITSNYLWLTLWKSIGLCLNRGQLTKAYDTQSLVVFAVALLLPVNIIYEEHRLSEHKNNYDDHNNEGAYVGKNNAIVHPYKDVHFTALRLKGYPLLQEMKSYVLRIVVHLIVFAALAPLYLQTKEGTLLSSWLICWVALFFISVIQDLNSLVCLAIFQLKIAPNFNKPYLALSITEFWSKRWNMVMGAQLKEIIYDPIMDGKWLADEEYYKKRKVSFAMKIVGTIIVFFVSGVLHSLVFMQLGNTWQYPYLCTIYFVAISLYLIAEKFVHDSLRKLEIYNKLVSYIPKFVLILYTQLVLTLLSHYLFWPDMARVGVTKKNIEGLLAFTTKIPRL